MLALVGLLLSLFRLANARRGALNHGLAVAGVTLGVLSVLMFVLFTSAVAVVLGGV